MDFKLKTAFRDSKTATRPYVLVNPMLGKHLPVSPGLALDCFAQLGGRIAAHCKGEKVLVIGFAETATAVGAAVAAAIEGAVYVHTTREEYKDHNVADFFEEHSHAKNQSLYLLDEYKNLSAYDRIVFVEDEITTGKTIWNFLQTIEYGGKIIVAALVFNGFDKSAFAQYDADFFCLQKVGYVNHLEFKALFNPRFGIDISAYQIWCVDISSRIIAAIDKAHIRGKDILVIGTEEFMYPALITGSELEGSAKSVKSQSTTRSPLLPRDNKDYPLYSRDEFKSVYDNDRTTYLYNLERYDTAIIITDAKCDNYGELIRVITDKGSKTIYYVRIDYAD